MGRIDGKFSSLAVDTGIRFKLSDYRSDAEAIAGIAVVKEVEEKLAGRRIGL